MSDMLPLNKNWEILNIRMFKVSQLIRLKLQELVRSLDGALSDTQFGANNSYGTKLRSVNKQQMKDTDKIVRMSYDLFEAVEKYEGKYGKSLAIK